MSVDQNTVKRVARLARLKVKDEDVPRLAGELNAILGFSEVLASAALAPKLASLPADEVARRRMDLAIVSVLLDAGAGPDWKYREAETGETFARSEGLGVASFDLFAGGLFAANPFGRSTCNAGGPIGPPGTDHLTEYGRLHPLPPERRLACTAHVTGDLVVDVPPESQVHRQVVRVGDQAAQRRRHAAAHRSGERGHHQRRAGEHENVLLAFQIVAMRLQHGGARGCRIGIIGAQYSP